MGNAEGAAPSGSSDRTHAPYKQAAEAARKKQDKEEEEEEAKAAAEEQQNEWVQGLSHALGLEQIVEHFSFFFVDAASDEETDNEAPSTTQGKEVDKEEPSDTVLEPQSEVTEPYLARSRRESFSPEQGAKGKEEASDEKEAGAGT